MIEDAPPLTNREAARQPRGRSFWCHACDSSLVRAGAKCGQCGDRAGKKRGKKPI